MTGERPAEFRWHRVVWSAPNARTPQICSHCFGALPEAPLMVWKPDGSGASFCDRCTAMLVRQMRSPAQR